MTRKRCFAAAIGLFLVGRVLAVPTPLGTVFTYQGQLKENGQPVNGPVDLEFTLSDSPVLGLPIGAPITRLNVPAVDGLFTEELDFGNAAFGGDERWLQVRIRRPAGVGEFQLISPRQRLNAAPYSLFSLNTYWRAVGANITNTNSGFVGVNRSSPLTGAEYFGIQAQATGTNYGGMYIRTDSATAKPFYGYTAGTETAWTYLDGATGSWHVFNDAIRMTIEDTGSVGIGETNPSARLHVETSSAGDALFVTQTGTGRAAQFYVGNASTANAIYAVTYGGGYAGSFEAHEPNTTAALNVYKNQGPALRVWSTLSAGGTPATDAAMAVVGGSDSEPAGGGFLVLGSVASVNVSIDNNEIMARNNGAAATLALNADGGNITLIQTGAGGVSIGTTALPPGALLAVDGKVLCEEVEVQLSGDWPDFVFAEDYPLLSLDDLQRSIDENGHLPGVPSAAQVAERGINVGQMHAQTLQKVEELTLYVLQLNAELNNLRHANQQLQERISSLENPRRE
jgi:hypothetical protein